MKNIWDPALRISHWLLPLLIACSWITAEFAGRVDWFMSAHLWLGFAWVSLLSFRILWGLSGSHYARFNHWSLSPRKLISALKGKEKLTAGHSALGSWMSVTLLLLICAQVFSGLTAFDDGLYIAGPLSDYFNSDQVEQFTHWHHLIFDALMIMAGIHISAILIYKITGTDYIRPMITGKKPNHMVPKTVAQYRYSRLALCSSLVIALGIATSIYWGFQV